MDIFVWVSHGEVEVHAAETTAQLLKILDTICECVDGWGLEKSVERCARHAVAHHDSVSEIRRAITTMLDAVSVGSHEMFECGTGFSKLVA